MRRRAIRRRAMRGGGALAILLLLVAPARAANPDALWQIVSQGCVPDEQVNHKPAPCAVVDARGGYAVLKDRVGREQFLLIPTIRTEGIEAPALLRAGTPNYFAEAWTQVPLVEARLGHKLPREDVSLAINSAYGRSQNQLHIHIDCIAPAVHDALAAGMGGIGTSWTALRTKLAGHHYRAMRIPGERLGENPFGLLARSLADPARQMGRHTLVLVGARFPALSRPGRATGPGFILLDGQLDRLGFDQASGEELQDHSCAILGLPVAR